MMQLETINGTVERFLFQNLDNGFCIFILQTAVTKTVTVKGNLINIQVGQEVELKGTWIFNNKFGKQFQATYCISSLPKSLNGLKKYLGSGLIKGIGKVYAEKLVNHFQADILDIIENRPHKLNEISGIGQKRIEQITTAWKEQKEIANIMIFLQDKGVSATYATKIYKRYRQDSLNVLNSNPYKIADDIFGIGFKIADSIAQKLGFEPFCQPRICAGILYAISAISQQGHLYIELEKLKTNVCNLLELNLLEHEVLIKDALQVLYSENKIVVVADEGENFITLNSFFYSEKGVARRIKHLLLKPSIFTFDLDGIYNSLKLTNAGEISLSEDQQRGIISCLTNKVTIITGGPGTGKTTLIKKLLSTLDAEKINYKLAAPTGRAAKRITESTGRYAVTIHRLLEFDVSIMQFTNNESNALKLDFLIIDEASMIDIFLAHAILKAMPENAHLVFIGDIDQLPSVGPGNLLSDLISSEIVPFVKLNQIFRQAQDSLIIVNAHRVNNKEFPTTNIENAKKDFIYKKEEDPELITGHLKQILFIELPKRGMSVQDAMVLTPMNRGIVGTYSLNHILQELLNPDKNLDQINYSGTIFKVNDKIMQIRNNYDKNVFNGDIGVINEIDLSSKQLFVNYGYSQERLVEYDFDELDEIILAYAISIHKSQGSEYNAVIIPMFTQHYMMLQKNLLYTAITRAKKLCILLGQVKAIAMAVKNDKGNIRKTFLKKFLLED